MCSVSSCLSVFTNPAGFCHCQAPAYGGPSIQLQTVCPVLLLMADSVLSSVSRLSGGLLPPAQQEEQADQLRSVQGTATPSSVPTDTLKQLASQASQPTQFIRYDTERSQSASSREVLGDLFQTTATATYFFFSIPEPNIHITFTFPFPDLTVLQAVVQLLLSADPAALRDGGDPGPGLSRPTDQNLSRL